ncbi:MAG: hypothetical protein MN733_28215, partial [Nitrososphaera sp.]|nr:hypothetical protein [Nitrososphaera sp.]
MRASKLVSAGRKYLLAQPGITETILDNHLTQWRKGKKSSVEALFRSMADHAKNRGGMPNYIGKVENLSRVLYNFHPRKIIGHYSTWHDLFDEIRRQKIKVPSRMARNNPRNSWVVYTKAIISGAQFLSTFRTAQEFHKFVSAFYTNEHSKLALPLLLEKEIFGFGFALACDFLKENGYPEFIKPDTHVKDIVGSIGITHAETDYGVFKEVVAYCAKNELVPYEFDKLLWLIGSGNFYLSGMSVPT